MTTYKQLLTVKRQLDARHRLLENELAQTKRAIDLLGGTIEAIEPGFVARSVEAAEQLVDPIRQTLAARGRLTKRDLRQALKEDHKLRAPSFAFMKAIEMLTQAGTISFQPTPEGDPAWALA